ncbi:MAG: group II intron reverse transcriptase/maturase [Gemmatimonadetes bacterium RBG_16_66_8]|nr:MAG: group II intron reverse transcriptase/maturase [Gemmatimonadetes bacterium RBG_16_66_8]
MSRGKARHQMSSQLELALEAGGEAAARQRSGEAGRAAQGQERSGSHAWLMEQVVARENAIGAFHRVRRNKGSPGIDGMTVKALGPYLREQWPALREALLAGRYRPNAVKRQLIPKSRGGMRQLGIPTVLDRFVQQLLLQVLQPIFDPTFSEHSHGFRPGRRAHDAVREAQRYIQEGRRWVVDVDLEKFFDRVNHDVLMGKLHNRIGDRRVLRIIHRYLEAGMLADGVVVERHEGTPQGGPLSPLLANVLLDDVDKALERRGHAFVRYADDCNVYVRSERAGQRVLAALRQQYGTLKLRINDEKSAVARVWSRKFLGYSFWVATGDRVTCRVAGQALEELKQRVRRITRRTGGRSMVQVTKALGTYLRGWKEYFQLAATPGIFARLDGWIHRRLRALQLKQWKRGRTTFRELQARGVPAWLTQKGANHGRRWWWAAGLGALHTALPGAYFERLGVPRLAAPTSTR